MRAFAVLGSWRGGTSLVTSVLQSLGVFVGDRFFDTDGYCTFEDVRLRAACLDCFDERPGRWCYSGTRAERSRTLGLWIDWARHRAREEGAAACGGKHPILCKLVDELCDAWKHDGDHELCLVAVIRNPAEIQASWTRQRADRSHWWPRPDREYVVDDLIRSRDMALAGKPVVRIDFERLRSDPAATVAEFVADCGLDERRIPAALQRIKRRQLDSHRAGQGGAVRGFGQRLPADSSRRR